MKFTHCPSCGEKDSVEQLNPTDYQCSKCQTKFWNNPRGASAAVFLKDNQILVAKRGIEPDLGKYELPGGFVNFGEDPYEACVREIKEETGITINSSDLVLFTAYTCQYMPHVSSLDMLFIVKSWSGEPVAADDVASLHWKPISFVSSPDFIRPYTDFAERIQPYL